MKKKAEVRGRRSEVRSQKSAADLKRQTSDLSPPSGGPTRIANLESRDDLPRSDFRLPPYPALLAAARAAARHAHCPYSRFPVGAALLVADGRVFTGANVENASYGLTLCAERSALVAAVSAGVRAFRALAVAGGGRTPATPCGACRQVLAEFCADAMPVFCTTLTGRGPVRRTTIGRLLPDAFRLRPVPAGRLANAQRVTPDTRRATRDARHAEPSRRHAPSPPPKGRRHA